MLLGKAKRKLLASGIYGCTCAIGALILTEAMLAGSDDEREIIKQRLNSANWGSVREVEIIYPALDLALTFDSGLSIHTCSASSVQDNQWILYTPDGMALTIGGGGRYQYGPSNSY